MTLLTLGIFGLLFLGVWLGIRIFEWRQIFQPESKVQRTPDEVGLTYKAISFVAEDSTFLQGWWIPSENAVGTLIYLHGSGGNMGGRVDVLRDLHRLGLNVFTFDYRGYGKSRGIPTEKGLYRDARAAFEVVRSQYDDAENPPVVAYGRSLGGAVAVQLARDKPLRGLIVEGSFCSAVDVGEHRHPNLPVRRLSAFRFDSAAKVGDLTLPKLIVHSRDDEVIPFDQGRRLYDACAEPRRFVELRGGHDKVGWVENPGYWDVFRRFAHAALDGNE